MCMIDDSVTPEFYTRTTITRARKAHRCDECGRTIEAGESYDYISAKWDGYFDTFHMCAHCTELWRWFAQVCGGTLHGGMGEDLAEHWDEYRQPNLGRLLLRFRRRWADTDLATIRRLVEGNQLYRDVRAAA